jgi:hypothetical protein
MAPRRASTPSTLLLSEDVLATTTLGLAATLGSLLGEFFFVLRRRRGRGRRRRRWRWRRRKRRRKKRKRRRR